MGEREFFCDDGYDDDGVTCPRCMGDGTVNCYCAGDFCICDNFGDADCPVCHTEGTVTPEREAGYFKSLAEQRELLRELFASPRPATPENGHE